MMALFLNDKKGIHKCVLCLGFTVEEKNCLLSFVKDGIYLYGLKTKLRAAFDLFNILFLNNRFELFFQFTLASQWKVQKSVSPQAAQHCSSVTSRFCGEAVILLCIKHTFIALTLHSCSHPYLPLWSPPFGVTAAH